MTYQCPDCFDSGSVCEPCLRRDYPHVVAARAANPAPRPAVRPGILIDDEPEQPPRSWRRRAALWALRLAMVAAGAAIMYAEGQAQPTPGVGFAIALALVMGAALLGNCDNG